MAENKRSFLLYCDIIHTVKKLNDDKAGILFKHILSYVNDENPESNDMIIDLVFEPIKQALKRDLIRYENICQRNRINGLKGGRPSNPEEPKEPSGLIGNPKNPDEPKKADNDSDIDIESDIEKEIRIKKELVEKKLEIKNKLIAAVAAASERNKVFYNSLVPFLEMYSKEMIKAFYDYWNELNKNKTQMRFEKEPTWELGKRLATWSRREKPNNKSVTSNKSIGIPKDGW